MSISFANVRLADLHLDKALAFHRAGQLSEAQQSYTDALECNPELVEAYNNRAAVRWQLKNSAGAFSDFGQALRLKPDFPTAHNNRGAMRRELGDLSGALDDFNQAIRLHPCYAEALENRASLHNFRWNHARAVMDFTRALELYAADKGKQSRCLLLRVFRGDALYHLGQHDEALADYREVFARRSEFFVKVAYRTVMQSLQQHGEAKMFEDCARHIARDVKPGLSFVRRAMMLYSLGRTEEADADNRRCQELCPPGDREMLEMVMARASAALRKPEKEACHVARD